MGPREILAMLNDSSDVLKNLLFTDEAHIFTSLFLLIIKTWGTGHLKIRKKSLKNLSKVQKWQYGALLERMA